MTMAYKVGVMQGRLLPKYKERYQAHPIGCWQKEFYLAAELSIDLIEFIFDYNDYEDNPLMSDAGIDEIKKLSANTGVSVKTICADYFMEAPLHSLSDLLKNKSQRVLAELIKNASMVGVKDIVIPCVDNSRLADEKAIFTFRENIKPALGDAEKFGVNLALETDLAPEPFADLLEKLDSPRITVNYDTGNSASLGYDTVKELAIYGNRISDIHIKDRVMGGGSVALGTGATDFERFFSALAKTDYSGPFIMQVYRDEEGIEIFKKQLAWIKPKLEAWSLGKCRK